MKAAKTIFSALALLSAGALAAQTATFNTPADWTKKPESRTVTLTDGVLTVTGNVTMISTRKFDFDPAKTYTLKAMAKTSGTEKSMFYFGFNLYDKDGRQIDSTMTNIVSQTDTELVAPVKKGDTTIKVKDGSKWKVRTWSGLVYNSDPSYSDLPNRSYLACPLKAVKQEGDAWTLTFSKPLTVDLAAGTKVRQHAGGGYMYAGKYGQLTGEWQTFTGSAKGLLKAGFNFTKFAPGTAKVSLVMLVNWGNPKATAEIKDISLDIK